MFQNYVEKHSNLINNRDNFKEIIIKSKRLIKIDIFIPLFKDSISDCSQLAGVSLKKLVEHGCG
jgi:hypothetical protein